jgi:F0F1-type ATP synthase epsilon subunit
MDEIRYSTTLTVTVRTREKVLFQDDAPSLTSTNDRGLFDVLPEHENFISVVKEKVIIHGHEKEFTFTTGILRVEENKVTVYIGVTNTVDENKENKK